MTVKELYESIPRADLCHAIMKKFYRYNTRCDGDSAIASVLDRYSRTKVNASDCIVRLLDLGPESEELDVVVYEPTNDEPFSFVMEHESVVLGYQVDPESIDRAGALRCAVDIFWEMTFFPECTKVLVSLD